ncbi:uncharacterized protein LOC131294196 [Anopheles ziemanni]|uniref:uncharacterized protein LOC131264902 n=1 Tax=Anopheles coustani TaxID=139045 RepID=UPI002657FC1D|nr:uncharacterized protein LOC131264902 [Anopheles coustani]XP_058178224.1 uncharacterized protein LOC131294196 [Anopheles ziemanni]
MVYFRRRLCMLIYLLCVWCRVGHQQPLEQRLVAAEPGDSTEPIPAIYNTPPQSPVKILRETGPITEQDSMKAPDDMQQSESYTYSYYRPLYYPGVYYSYYPRYRWYRPYYYYNWWYY